MAQMTNLDDHSTKIQDNGPDGVEVFVIILAGLLALALSYAVWLKYFAPHNYFQTINNLNSLQGQISQLYATRDSYAGLSAQVLIDEGIVPANMIYSDGDLAKLMNAFGGPVTITPSADNATYRITYHQVPQEHCIFVVTKFGLSLPRTSYLGLSVAGDDSTSIPETPDHKPPYNAEIADTHCTDKTANTISFYNR
ncbi:MAG: hypothetical protein Alpg2KO_10590 [Alphaproteobacteria bacterium]